MVRQRVPSDDWNAIEGQVPKTSPNFTFQSRPLRVAAHKAVRYKKLAAFLLLIIFGVCFWFSYTHVVRYFFGGIPLMARFSRPDNHDAPRTTLGHVGLVLIAHDRPEYLRQCLKHLFLARSLDKVDLIVSMDEASNFQKLLSVVNDFASEQHPFIVWDNTLPPDSFTHSSTDHITAHHRQILDKLFLTGKYEFGIILETDLTVSTDFIEYMLQTAPLLHPINPSSESLWCISGWNDNGIGIFTWRENRLFRTDFYPGLGWMTHKSRWLASLRNEWPSSVSGHNYDVWLRNDSSLKQLDCISPEVSRTHHVAKYGTHVNGDAPAFYESMMLASGNVEISRQEIWTVGSLYEYETRIASEFLLHSSATVHVDGNVHPIEVPKNSTIIIFANDENRNAPNSIESVLGDLKLWGDRRGMHRGLISVRLATQGTNVTVVAERMRKYWGL